MNIDEKNILNHLANELNGAEIKIKEHEVGFFKNGEWIAKERFDVSKEEIKNKIKPGFIYQFILHFSLGSDIKRITEFEVTEDYKLKWLDKN